jgi:hypothetical protein
MKSLLLVCFILSGLFSRAQFKLPASKFNFNYDFSKNYGFTRPLNTPTFPKAMFSIENSYGKIYILPVDKMPCLVPDISHIIPIPIAKNPFTNSLMLNPYTKEELIPAQ